MSAFSQKRGLSRISSHAWNNINILMNDKSAELQRCLCAISFEFHLTLLTQKLKFQEK